MSVLINYYSLHFICVEQTSLIHI